MEKENIQDSGSSQSSHVFWGEMAPCDHVIQMYEKDDDFLDHLEAYVCGGILAKEAVIVVATASHIQSLQIRLNNSSISTKLLKEQYTALDAESILAKFMVNGWPNEKLFNKVFTDLLEKAKKNYRNVRAFGEMVALLWAKGNCGATVHLEHLWNKFCESASYFLFCVYPKTGSTQSPNTSIMYIDFVHKKMVEAKKMENLQIVYRDTPFQSAGRSIQ